MRFRSIGAALAVLLLALTACSLPLRVASSASRLLAVITTQAGAITGMQSATAPAVPVTGGTATPGAVQVSVTAPTNCRSGPSTDYPLVVVINPGMEYQAVGKYSGGSYWIIANPAGGTCWLWGTYAVVTGNVGSLPVYMPPALTSITTTPAPSTGPVGTATASSTPPTMTSTPTQGPTHAPPPPPAAPANLVGARNCTVGSDANTPIWIEVVTLTWHDTLGETGYRIYEDGAAVSTIAQNSMTYQIQLRYNQGASGTASDTFAVEAYNTGGTSAQASVNVPRCP